jgi:N-glycosylase/DNA lyase
MVQVEQTNTTNKMVEYLLLRQHVSALALGHHQVSNCVSEETIQCSIHIVHIIQRDLMDKVTTDNCQKKLVYKIKIINYIRSMYAISKMGVVMD